MKKRTYYQVSKEERDLICVFKAEGRSIREIGKLLNRSASTISRELRRNAPPIRIGRYLSHKAQQRAEGRKSKAHRKKRLKSDQICQYVEDGLKLFWTPEQIAGRLSITNPSLSISHEAIYQYIYSERHDLIVYLPRHHKKRQNRGHSRKHRKSHIPNRISIEERPEHIERRQQPGHWESDTISSRKSKDSLVVTVERKTRLTLLSKIEQRLAEEVKNSLVWRLEAFPVHLRRSITYDNGTENTLHEKVNEQLGTVSYFCHPYASWEKGTIENTNGLIRRFFPKKTDFSKISQDDVKFVEFLLNNKPRKCLNYLTPNEVFNSCVALKC